MVALYRRMFDRLVLRDGGGLELGPGAGRAAHPGDGDGLAGCQQNGGSPTEPAAPGGRGGGDRQFEQARTALAAVRAPRRWRTGTWSSNRCGCVRAPGRADRRGGGGGSTQTAPIVSVKVLRQLVEELPALYGLAALMTAFAGLRGGETFALAVRHRRYGQSGGGHPCQRP